jgi:2,3-dimethylmalate lyase
MVADRTGHGSALTGGGLRRAAELRRLLAEPGIHIMPGVYDALSARLAEQVGFRVINVGGAMVANSILGLPDVGLTSLTEMAEQIRRVTAATTVPAIADADTGYGNAVNVMRTVREFEAAGAAGMYLEDQVFPKKCGHFAGKEVIPTAEMVGKIEAAVEARRDDDFVIIARTDARAELGFDEAVERSNVYAEAGADMIFFEAPHSEDELRRIPSLVSVPVLANMISGGGLTPLLTAAALGEMGFKLVNYGAASQQAAMAAALGLYRELMDTGTTAGYLDRMLSFDERQARIGLPEVLALERRFADRTEESVRNG